MKDAAQYTQDGSVKVLILPIVIFQRRNSRIYIHIAASSAFWTFETLCWRSRPRDGFRDIFLRFGVGGARSAARRHGEVVLRMRRHGLKARGRVAISSAQSARMRARSTAR